MQLNPYLHAADEEHRRAGLPIARHLRARATRRDRGRAPRTTQYLLGPDLLAAPVTAPGRDERAASGCRRAAGSTGGRRPVSTRATARIDLGRHDACWPAAARSRCRRRSAGRRCCCAPARCCRCSSADDRHAGRLRPAGGLVRLRRPARPPAAGRRSRAARRSPPAATAPARARSSARGRWTLRCAPAPHALRRVQASLRDAAAAVPPRRVLRRRPRGGAQALAL